MKRLIWVMVLSNLFTCLVYADDMNSTKKQSVLVLAQQQSMTIDQDEAYLESLPTSQQQLISLKVAAEKGDANAELEYGMALNNKNNKTKAQLWIQKAADQGLGEAWFMLGYAGLDTKGKIYDYSKAMDAGYIKAKDEFANFLSPSLSGSDPIDWIQAKQYAAIAEKYQLDICYTQSDVQRSVDICNSVGTVTIPLSDMPSSAEKKYYQTAKLDDDFLYAIKDWVNYRKDLIASNTDGSNNYEIAEIYANGWGVKRNPLLALSLVCRTKGDPFENIQMIDDLNKSKNQQKLLDEFSYCDYARGNNSIGCDQRAEAVAEDEADYKRTQKLARQTQNWTATQKAAFNILKSRAEDFITEHAYSEQDLSGTARDEIITGEEQQLQDQFAQAVKSFEAGKMPKDTDFTKADKQMNVLYLQVMVGVKKLPAEDLGLTETPDGIRKTQLKWLKYRDAWVAFAKLRYSNVAPNVFATWITKQRNKQLNELLATDFDCCYDLSG